MIDYEYSDLFLENSIPKQILISFDGATLTNEDLYNQELSIEENLCSLEELRFGCCEASVLKFKISDIFSPMVGKWLEVKMVLDGNSSAPFIIGRYKVDSDTLAADRRYREVVAYDAMYDIINSSAIEWYNKILPDNSSKVTMRKFRTSFIESFGLKQQDVTLANDGMVVEKTIQVGEGEESDTGTEQVSILKESSLSGLDVITKICEINGCFGHIGRDGKFHYIYLRQDIGGLYPSGDLFPDHAPEHLAQSKTGHLYPQSPNSYRIDKSKYISCNRENFFTKRITKLQIRNGENDIGKVYPDGGLNPEDNCYIIEDNFLVYGKTDAQLHEIAKNVFGKIADIVYMPFSADTIGNPCLEVGDAIRIPTTYDIVESYVLQRTLKGTQALRDEIKANGSEKYAEKINGVQSSIIQLKGKTNTLVRNVDETRSELVDFKQDTNGNFTDVRSSIVQTAKEITATVSKNTQNYDTKDYEISLSGYVEPSDKNMPYKANEHSGKYYLNQSNGSLYQSNGNSWIYVETLQTVMESAFSEIRQTADSITQSVSNARDELSSRIAQTAASIEMGVTNGEKTAGIKISLKNEQGEEIANDSGNIEMTGIVTFNNLSAPGETVIDGGNIKTNSIDASRINVKTLYVEEELRIRHTNLSDGTSTMRTALLMEDVPGQTFPNLIIGSNRNYANVIIKNDFECEGANGISTTYLYASKKANLENGADITGNIDVSGKAYIGEDVILQKTGAKRGLKGASKASPGEIVAGIDADDVTTLIGLKSSGAHPTKTSLRGNSVILGSSGATVTSDERLKNSFKPLDEFDEVYMDIEPCAFKYNNGTSGRYHFGVKAQNVKEAFESHGYTTQDFGGFVQMADSPENEDYCGVDDPMGIIYTEFTMWNAHMIQKLYKKIEAQKSEIESLKKSISFLMERIEMDE